MRANQDLKASALEDYSHLLILRSDLAIMSSGLRFGEMKTGISNSNSMPLDPSQIDEMMNTLLAHTTRHHFDTTYFRSCV